jgi:hypothetical protein
VNGRVAKVFWVPHGREDGGQPLLKLPFRHDDSFLVILNSLLDRVDPISRPGNWSRRERRLSFNGDFGDPNILEAITLMTGIECVQGNSTLPKAERKISTMQLDCKQGKIGQKKIGSCDLILKKQSKPR